MTIIMADHHTILLGWFDQEAAIAAKRVNEAPSLRQSTVQQRKKKQRSFIHMMRTTFEDQYMSTSTINVSFSRHNHHSSFALG